MLGSIKICQSSVMRKVSEEPCNDIIMTLLLSSLQCISHGLVVGEASLNTEIIQAILIMAGFGPQSTKQKKDRTARVKQKRRTFAPHREIRPSDGPHKPCLWKSSYCFYYFRAPLAQTLLCLPSYLLSATARERRKKGRGRGPKGPFLQAGGLL